MDNLSKINLTPEVPPPPQSNVTEDGVLTIPKLGSKSIKNRLNNIRRFRISDSNSKSVKIVLSIVAVLIGLFIISMFMFLFILIDAIQLRSTVETLKVSANDQNITKMEEDLEVLRSDLDDLQSSYSRIAWMRFIPFLGKYVEDGAHVLIASEHGLEAGAIMLETIKPYADIIGLSGEGSSSPDQTAQDRLDFVVQTLPEITAKIDELATEILAIQLHLEYIDPSDYPKSIGGLSVREEIERGVRLANSTSELVTSGKPLIQRAPYLLGADETRKYLILFQNDKELRPTGGFLTAYTIAQVNKARFEPVQSDDIYNIDARYEPVIPAPDPIINHIKGVYLLNENYRLRDMNWNPDFSKSMELFTEEAKKVGIEDIDGVIAVDTQLLVNILDALGPIEVPEFGRFSTDIIEECNCPQVVYELESFADTEGPVIYDPITGDILQAPENIDNRKKIIGPLMNSVLAAILGAPSNKVPALFDAGFRSMLDKNVLIYMLDDESQSAVESFGIAGRIHNTEGDYLHINDANLGGRKSNLYVTTEVVQNIDVSEDGTVTKTVEITYKNPQKHDGWLNSMLPNYLRVYVPDGSEILDAAGFLEFKEPYTELGKTVFAGFFEVRPQGVSKVTLTYKLPFNVDTNYPLMIQKQPGANMPFHQVKIGKIEDEFFLNSDKTLNYQL